MRKLVVAFATVLTGWLSASGARADKTLQVVANYDASMVDGSSTTITTNTNNTADGAGHNLFSGGATANGIGLARALVHFDVSSIPTTATITGVTVALQVNKRSTGATATTYQLRAPALTTWNEGTSVGATTVGATTYGTPEVAFAGATTGDATWNCARRCETVPCIVGGATCPGGAWLGGGASGTGTLNATQQSATEEAGATGTLPFSLSFSSNATLVATVQSWVDGSANGGWLVEGDSAAGNNRMFTSHNASGTVNVAPTITVTYKLADNATCSSAADCEGGFCVNSFCCDSACNTPGTCQTTPPTSCCVYGSASSSTTCSDGNACTVGDHCSGSGSCTSGTSTTCTSPPTCYTGTGTCNTSTGVCSYTPASSSTSCSDGNACTVGDHCDGSGSCTSGTSTTCTSPPTCYTGTGTCNTSTGVCSYTPASSSTSCSDGNACTVGDHCDGSGSCTSGATTSCTSPPTCYTGTGTCNTSTGVCSYTPASSSTSCSDGNACTVGDHCDGSGSCTSGATTSCTSPPTCYDSPGTCNTSTGACSYTPSSSSTSCSDGNACTVGDHCSGSGSCTSGTSTTCTSPPNTQCYNTTGACNTSTGACSYTPLSSTTSCSDGNACTSGDHCDGAGNCSSGTTVTTCTSPPNTQCYNTTGACNTSTGACSYTPLSSTTSCSDGNACTSGDHCDGAGTCDSGTTVTTCTSPPNTQCYNTTGTCNTSTGICGYTPLASTTSCSDGNACTSGDHCDGAGTCDSGTTVTTCTSPPNTQCYNTTGTCNTSTGICGYTPLASTTSCSDGNACTSGDHCDGAGTCDSGTTVTTCTSPPNTQCYNTTGICNTSTGICGYTPLASTTSCSDGNACTSGDHCDGAGTCDSGTTVTTCTSPPNTQCYNTTGICNTSTGICGYTTKTDGTLCNDGKTCTLGEFCTAGTCGGGTAPDCSSFNDQCNTGVCVEPGGCQAQANTNAPCSDGSFCTSGDKCTNSGTCVGTAVDCDDGNPCTTDTCIAASGCSNVGFTGSAAGCTADSNPCTIDSCVSGVCHSPVADGTSCGAAASCSGAAGSASEIPAVSCASGVCPSQTPISCGASPCNAGGTACEGACASDTDCSSLATPPGYYCAASTCTPKGAAGNPCTLADQCQAGLTCADGVCCTGTGPAGSTCGNGDPNDCVTCNGTAPGTCTTVADATKCDDGIYCNGTDKCKTGACTVHAGNPCPGPDGTSNCANSCSESGKTCTANDPDGSGCNDGKFCTVGDSCASGVCVGGARDCSAFTDQCNTGVCNESAASCQASPISGTSCTDGNACTTGDECLSGSCTPTGTVSCATPPNACYAATGTCNTTNGTCSYTPLSSATTCSDGNACTAGDHCSGSGTCLSGTTVTSCTTPPNTQCYDTAGTCNTTTGVCAYTPKANTTSCSDGNACTAGDHCDGAGTCVAGSTVTSCTTPPNTACYAATGTCNTTTGACSYTALSSATTCSDGNACTAGNHCNGSGTCLSGTTVTSCNSPPNTQCYDAAGTCDTTTGVCAYSPLANTTTCTDGNACTVGDHCDGSGNCSSGAATVCNTPPNSCQTTPGTCNPASGSCSYPSVSNTTPCGSPAACTVTGGTASTILAVTCNNGACPVQTPISCGANPCNAMGTGCQGPCAIDTDCPPAFYCNATSQCVPTIGAGTQCTRSTECQTGLTCVDGVCCTGKGAGDTCGNGDPNDCVTCNGTTPGTCTALADAASCDDGVFCDGKDSCASGACSTHTGNPCPGPDGDSNCAESCSEGGKTCTANDPDSSPCEDGSLCTTGDTCHGGLCVSGPPPVCNDGLPCTVDSCDPAKGCIAPAGNRGTPCGVPASCATGQETIAPVCDGTSSTCPAATTQSCGLYACGGTVCLTSCAADGDSDCAQGNYCAASNQCTPKGKAGDACATGDQCLSSSCADGVCCNSDCTGQCEACNLTGTVGVCTAVIGKPVTPRAACIGDGTGCDGTCDGTDRQACTMPGKATQCRAPSCDMPSETATLSAACDGSGSCPAKTTQGCSPAVCGPTQCEGCETDAQCGTGKFCRAGVCSTLTGSGGTCSRDAECSSAHCVDGVCCNSDCTGQCEACNLTGTIGVCTPVPAGTAPSGARTACNGTGNQCGGTCDGTNPRTCAYPGPGVSCRAPDCQNDRATLEAFCDGAGTCPPIAQQDCPAADTCVGTLCSGPGSCTGDTDCSSTQYCSGGVCVPQKDVGTSCNTAAECTSSECVDGYCCSSACTGQCQACDVSGFEGICTPVGGAPHGSRKSCSSDGTVCAGACDGSNPTACAYPGAAIGCRAPSCANGVATLGAACQGDGSCAPLQLQSCDPVGCDTNNVQCAGTCTIDSDCPSGNYCSAGICVPESSNGATCGAAAQCASGNCVDGVCCDTACTGQCASCDRAGAPGTCGPVSGAPRDGRPACPGSGACGGFCDGTNQNSCSMPNLDISCGVAFCAGGFSTAIPTCNGNGQCLIPTPTSCDPYECDSSGLGCLSSCVADSDCALGLVCVDGACAQPSPSPDAGNADSGTDASVSTGGRSSPDAGLGGTGGTGASLRDASAAGAGGRAAGGQSGSAGKPSDAGSTADAGSPAKPRILNAQDRGSCGCRVPGSASTSRSNPAPLLALLALLALRRRRSSTTSRDRSNLAAEPGHFRAGVACRVLTANIGLFFPAPDADGRGTHVGLRQR